MAKADWGTKRNCFSCATKFYDFKRDPILCPSCGKELLLEKPARIKLNKNNNEKTSKDDLPENEILEDDTKDDSIILEDDIIDEHINVVSNLEEHDNENDGIEVEISIHTETADILSCELPQSIETKIIYTEPGVKGDTATNATKLAKIETGAEIQVPLFINENDKVKIDIRQGKYVERVK